MRTLRKAAAGGDVTLLAKCIRKGMAEFPTASGVTLLMLAAANGRDDAVRLLIDKGANVEARTTNDALTPLMLAAAFGQLGAVKVLVEHGHLDLELKDKGDRRRAMEWAAGHAAVKSLARGEDEKTAGQKADDIMLYLKSKGSEVKKTDIVQGILMFASPPDVVALIEQGQ